MDKPGSGPNAFHTDDLRIPSLPRGKKIRIIVNGKPVTAFEGETVHAALTAAGIRQLKKTRADRTETGLSKADRAEADLSRGVFCGMGLCYECLVTIDRIPDQRACMTLVRHSMEVITGEG